MPKPIIEECCFNAPRDGCTGDGCACGCHAKLPRLSRREWETIKVADFERLERLLRDWLEDCDNDDCTLCHRTRAALDPKT